MATVSQVQEVVFRLKLEDQASDAMKAAVAALKELNKEFDLNDQVVQKAGKGANTLINQNDQISKTAKTLTNVLRDLSDAQKALAADAATGGEKQAALLRTVENLTTKVQAATQAHNDAVKGVKSVGDAHDDAAKKVGLFGLNLQKTGFLVHDATKAIESLTLGMSPLQVAMQHVGQVQGIFGSLSEAAKALAASFVSVPGVLIAATAALAGFGLMAESESRRMGDLRQQLRATHDDYASLATTVDAAAKQVAASTSLSTAQAREAAQTIASAKYFSGTTQDIVDLTKVSQDLAREWRVDVGEASKFLRGAIDDPGKAAKEMADKNFPGMSHALAESLARMQAAAQGGQALATVLGVLRQGTTGAVDDQSKLGKALKELEKTFYDAKDGGKSLAVTIGEMVDSFVALQVRGLNNLIKSLDAFIAKMKEVKQAYPASGLNLETGAANPGVTIPTTVTTTGGSAISQVDQSIRSLVAAAAKQYQVDTELLARLQLSENAKPIGTDLLGNSIWKASPTGPIGAMQVAPSTFAGMQNLPYGRQFQGQALGDNATNVNAGAAYFSYLLSKYGDVKLAVLAYHDGETRMDDVLAGRGNVSSSQDALDQALKVTRGYTGTGRGLVSAGPAFPGESLTAPNATANAGLALSGGIRDQDRATADTAFATAQRLGSLSELIAKNRADQLGLTAGIKLATDAGDTERVNLLSASLTEAKKQAVGLITEQAKLAQSSRDTIAPLEAESGATRTLAEVRNQFVIAARQNAVPVDEARLNAALADAAHKLALAFDDVVKAADRQTAANQRIAASVDQSAPSLIAATNREKALAQAREDFVPGPEREAAVDRYTAALNRESASVADLATKQKSFDQRDQLQVLQLETDTLGKSADARDKEIALLKERQALIKSGADLQSEASKADLANIAAIHDATVALNQQKASLSELSGFFTSTFDTIGNAIVSAFATGQQSAVKFKDVAASVEKAVEAEFLKLALLNPLKNFLFGENSPTLFSVGGVIGKLFGGGTSNAGLPAGEVGLTSTASGVSALEGLGLVTPLSGSTPAQLAAANNASTAGSGGVGLLQGAGVVGTLVKGVDFLTGGHLVSDLTSSFKSAIGFTSGQSIGSYVSSLIGEQVATTSTVTGGAAAGQTVAAAAFDDAATAGLATSSQTIGTIGSAVSTIAEALPYIGVAISVITDLAAGNLRGAGFVAGGGAVGAGIGLAVGGPPGAAIGAGIGALVGGLADALFPQHPLHPFEDIAVDVRGGHLQAGKTLSQIEDTSGGVQTVNAFGAQLDQFMQRVGVVITTADMTIGHLGDGIKNFEQFTKISDLFPRLSFGNAPEDISNFGVAKGALTGMRFNTPQELADELAKIAGFADATSALGIKLKAVGQDITNIQIASVAGADQGNDLRTALQHDLTTQIFANVAALDAEINKVNQFVNGTIPGLLHPVEQTTSAIVDQANKIYATYQQAVDQSLQYGLDNTAALRTAEEQALAIVRRSGVEQIQANATLIQDRFFVASQGGAQRSANQTADNFDIQAQQQRDALSKLWTDTYGDATKQTGDYLRAMNELETTLGAERVAIVKQISQQIAAAFLGLSDTVQSYGARIMAATGNPQGAQLENFDIKAAQERTAFIKSFTDFFGDAIQADATFQAQLATVDAAHYAERLQMLQSFQTQQDAAYQSLSDAVQSLGARDFASKGDQKTADLINFDMKARQERVAFQQSFVNLYGPAVTANEVYQAQLATLERVQGQERLQIIAKYGDAITGATAAQIQQARGSVSSLFTSLGDYVTKLQSGTNSPLSPTAQYGFAKGQFNAVAGAAAAGDATSAGKLTGFADTFLSASRAVYGSGVGYASDFSRVLDAIQSAVQAPVDVLTNSFLALQIQQQTVSITQAQQATTDAINALRREVMQQTRLMATAA